MGEVIWGIDFAKSKEPDYSAEFRAAWAALREAIESECLDLDVIYESPTIAERLHEVELPSDCERKD